MDGLGTVQTLVGSGIEVPSQFTTHPRRYDPHPSPSAFPSVPLCLCASPPPLEPFWEFSLHASHVLTLSSSTHYFQPASTILRRSRGHIFDGTFFDERKHLSTYPLVIAAIPTWFPVCPTNLPRYTHRTYMPWLASSLGTPLSSKRLTVVCSSVMPPRPLSLSSLHASSTWYNSVALQVVLLFLSLAGPDVQQKLAAGVRGSPGTGIQPGGSLMIEMARRLSGP